jgi:group I intron endonuclease
MQFNYQGNSLKSGIYKLVNKLNSRIYIGSAKEFKSRWQSHARHLRSGKHSNKYLQNDFNKCGEEMFEFHILELTEGTQEERRIREQFWIDQFHDKQEQCYNHRKDALVMEPNSIEELRKTQSQRTKELWQDPEYRAKHEEKIREFTQTKEYRQKLSEATKTKWADPEFQEKAKAIYQSEEFKQKVGKNSRKLWEDEEHRLKQSEARTAAWAHNENRKIQASERMKNTMAKTYTLRSPTGEIVTFTNMSKFCLEHGLQPSGLCNVAKNKWISYKGWTKPI